MPDEIRLGRRPVGLGNITPTAQRRRTHPASLTPLACLEYRQRTGRCAASGALRRKCSAARRSPRSSPLPVIVGHSAWITPATTSSTTSEVVDAGSAKQRGAFLAAWSQCKRRTRYVRTGSPGDLTGTPLRHGVCDRRSRPGLPSLCDVARSCACTVTIAVKECAALLCRWPCVPTPTLLLAGSWPA